MPHLLRVAAFGVVGIFLLGGCSEKPSPVETPSTSHSTRSLGKPGQPVPGEYIIVLKESVPQVREVASELAKAHGLQIAFTYNHALKGFSAKVPEGRLNALERDPRVDYVEQDGYCYADAQSLPAGINRIDADLNTYAKINGLDERVDVDVAIIDTGIDSTHTDLNYYTGANFTTDVGGGGVDGHGHGTHVSGTVGALDNGNGVVGAAPGVRLWAVKVLSSNGSGQWSWVIAGLNYCTANASQIEAANMSLGGTGYLSSVRTAVQSAVNAGIVVVVAAGNSNADVYGADGVFGTGDDFMPAAFPEVAAVSAMVDTDGKPGGLGSSTSYGADDTRATFSNYSRYVVATNPVTSPGKAIDVAAPGVSVYSTYKGNSYATMSGTSMASPHVAGSVGLYIAQYGRATNASGVYSIRQAIINNGQPQSAWRSGSTNDPDGNLEPLVYVGGSGGNNAPTVTIYSPMNGASFNYGNDVTFTGTASDVEDGDLSPNLNWNSSLDGAIGTGGSFIKNNLSIGTHTITAQVTDGGGATGSSAISITVLDPNTLSAPTNLSATQSAKGSPVELHWSDSNSNENGFRIERAVQSKGGWGDFGFLASVAQNVSTYSDGTVGRNTLYRYRVRAENSLNVSAWSNTAQIKTK
jgi:subtilisin